MAKIKQLFPDWELPVPDEANASVPHLQAEIASQLSREEPPMQAMLPFQKETEKVEMLQQPRDLLSFMLVTDPNERPSASAVLASYEFRAFKRAIGA